MKLFKSIDEKLSGIGFEKIRENKYCATYERENVTYGYTQNLDILHKESGRHIVLSCQKEVNGDNFNNVVGLSMYEVQLVYKKMKQMGWKVTR